MMANLAREDLNCVPSLLNFPNSLDTRLSKFIFTDACGASTHVIY